jgi:hypothetical protein
MKFEGTVTGYPLHGWVILLVVEFTCLGALIYLNQGGVIGGALIGMNIGVALIGALREWLEA